MGVAEDVVQWLDLQKPWISDAVRRIAHHRSVTDEELAALTEMVKNAHGIGDPGCVPVPLTLADLPEDGDLDAGDVTLLQIADTAHVNALHGEQTLKFERAGLTVVYGDNGSGKSGYARLLKQVCHARGARDRILPNVFAEATGRAAARLLYCEAGEDKAFSWDGESTVPHALSRVGVFDTNAALALVEQDNEVLWKPRGLDLLDRVVPVVTAIKKRLEQQAENVAVPLRLPTVLRDTVAGGFLAGLDAADDEEAVESLAMSATARQRLSDLVEATRSSGHGAEVKRLRGLAARLSALHGRARALEETFGATALAALAVQRARVNELQEMADAAATVAFGDEGVTGVGGTAWKALWSAAERFAASGATADEAFPSQRSDPICVLCLQPLPPGALARLSRFRSFVVDDLAYQVLAASGELSETEAAFSRASVSEAADDGLVAEIDAEEPAVGSAVRVFFTDLRLALAAVLARDEHAAVKAITPELSAMSQRLRARAEALEAADAAASREMLVREADELKARAAVWDAREVVRGEIRRRKVHRGLTAAVRDAVTTGISRKSTELSDKYLTEALLAAYAEEARHLRIGETVELKPTGTHKGRSLQRVALRLATWAIRERVSPGVVLSEGERRAVALATFLTELRMRSGRSAIVLDDPVSSLDHDRQDDVARRLVAEALHRQVIVFTHNLVFLRFLEDIAKEQRVPIVVREVAHDGTRPGMCSNEPPWKGKKCRQQIAWSRDFSQTERKRAENQPETATSSLAFAYGRLRQCAERALEECLLGGCVERYARGVHATALWKVRALEDQDVREYLKIYDHATKWGSVHDGSRAENVSPPTFADFDGDLHQLAELVKRVTSRHSGV